MTEVSYKILACDGGGIFGVITAKLLQSLDRSVLDNIDLFAGTSTGSIIALGLASGVSIDTIFDLYSSEQACSQIFQPYLPQADQTRLSEDVEAGNRGNERRTRKGSASSPSGSRGATARAGADSAVPEIPQRGSAGAAKPVCSGHHARGGLDAAAQARGCPELSAQRRHPFEHSGVAGATLQ